MVVSVAGVRVVEYGTNIISSEAVLRSIWRMRLAAGRTEANFRMLTNILCDVEQSMVDELMIIGELGFYFDYGSNHLSATGDSQAAETIVW